MAPNGMFVAHDAIGTAYFYANYNAQGVELKPLVEGQRLAVDALNINGAVVGRALDNGAGLLYWSSADATPVRVKQVSPGRTAYITGINRWGQMVGWEALSPDKPLYWPRFDAEPVPLPLQPEVAGGEEGRAYGITDSGLAYGMLFPAQRRQWYWRLPRNGAPEGPFEFESPVAATATNVLHVNAKEVAVGFTRLMAGQSPSELAIRYGQPDSFSNNLRWEPDTKTARAAYSNAAGLVVGTITDQTGRQHAVLWPASGIPMYLQRLFPTHQALFRRAVAVTDDNVVFIETHREPAAGKLLVLKWPY